MEEKKSDKDKKKFGGYGKVGSSGYGKAPKKPEEKTNFLFKQKRIFPDR